jgi:hypothetical protein
VNFSLRRPSNNPSRPPVHNNNRALEGRPLCVSGGAITIATALTAVEPHPKATGTSHNPTRLVTSHRTWLLSFIYDSLQQPHAGQFLHARDKAKQRLPANPASIPPHHLTVASKPVAAHPQTPCLTPETGAEVTDRNEQPWPLLLLLPPQTPTSPAQCKLKQNLPFESVHS